ncbi:MAG: hypothetical protein J7L07_06670, partial [Candidatus Odinarchaeota archaeon]|nr:hypothetical protein [Candidatus Odinarchaeota archaeon]
FISYYPLKITTATSVKEESMIAPNTNSIKNEDHDIIGQSAEQTFIKIANKTGYVHPMIARFYNYYKKENNIPEQRALEKIILPESENSSNSVAMNNEKAKLLFELDNKVPQYEGKTYMYDLNDTRLWEDLSISNYDYLGTLYGTYPYTNEHVSTLSTDPNNSNVPAPPQIVKETHWFPKETHARIVYQIYVYGTGYHNVKIHVVVQGDQDVYSRYFRVYWDSTKIYETIVRPYAGPYNLTFSILVYNNIEISAHLLTFEIYYGGYREFGWKLTSLWLEDAVVAGEYFPRQSYSKLSWKVLCGRDTKIDIYLRRVNDAYDRILTIYLDDQQVFQDIIKSYNELHINLGNFDDDSEHILTLRIHWGSYTERGGFLNY